MYNIDKDQFNVGEAIMLSKIAYVFGFFFLAIGVLGFVPQVAPGGLLFGVLHVNAIHNVIHIVTGVAALAAATYGWEKVFFQVFGVIYLIVALLGFYYGEAPIFGLVANNFADTIFHLVVGAFSAWVGFSKECCGVRK